MTHQVGFVNDPNNKVAIKSGDTGTKIAPESLGDIMRFGEIMAQSDIALPKHLRNNVGACVAVAMQALEWGMNPFAVGSKSYSVNGTIAYEAQLIAAVVNTRSGIQGRLKYRYEGSGDTLTCTVTGILDGEEFSYTSPEMGKITTKNSPLWKSDPQQQLGYFAARSWARRYVPEVLLGVYDREEMRHSEVNQPQEFVAVADPFASQPSVSHDAVTGEIEDAQFEAVNTHQDSAKKEHSEPYRAIDSANDAIERTELKNLIQASIKLIGEGGELMLAAAQSINAKGLIKSASAKADARAVTKLFIALEKGVSTRDETIQQACSAAGIDVAELEEVE